MNKTLFWIGSIALVAVAVVIAYRSGGPVEKAKDTMDDAVDGGGHVMENGGRRIKEAAH